MHAPPLACDEPASSGDSAIGLQHPLNAEGKWGIHVGEVCAPELIQLVEECSLGVDSATLLIVKTNGIVCMPSRGELIL